MNDKIFDKDLMSFLPVLIVVFTIAGSYAFFSYNKTGIGNSQIIAGDIYMHFEEDRNEIMLASAFPEKKEDAKNRNDNYVTFTIRGVNTTKNKDIYYEIKLNNGPSIEGIDRFNPEDICFELIKTVDGESTTVIDGLSYNELNGRRIYVNTIPKNTHDEIEITYQLRMWINEDVLISDTDSANYTTGEFERRYASVRIEVYGDFVEKTN